MASNDDNRRPLERSTFDRLVGDEPETRPPGSVPPKALDVVPFDWSKTSEDTETPAPNARRNTERGVGPSDRPPGSVSTPPPSMVVPLPGALPRDPAVGTLDQLALVDASVAEPRVRAEGGLPEVSAHQKKAWEASDPRAEAAEPSVPLDERVTKKRERPRNVLGRHVVAGIYTVETDYDWSDAEKARVAEEEIVRARDEAAHLAPGSDALLRLATEMRAKYGALIGPEAEAVDATSHAAIASLLVDVAKDAAAKEAALEVVKLEARSERAARLEEERRAESLARAADAERARADGRDEAAREAEGEAARALADKAKVARELEAARRQLAGRASDAPGTPSRKIAWIPVLLFLSLFVIAYLIWLAIWGVDGDSSSAASSAPAIGIANQRQPFGPGSVVVPGANADVARAQSTSDQASGPGRAAAHGETSPTSAGALATQRPAAGDDAPANAR